jgi:Ner family transcriptional regulator
MRSSDTPKKPAAQDWHPADIVAGLWKRRMSFIRLSRLHGYSGGSLRIALRRPWPKAERIIAQFIDVAPQEIWPSRYNADGSSKSGRDDGRRDCTQHNVGRRAA